MGNSNIRSMAQSIVESIVEQRDPRNRIVRKIDLIEDNSIENCPRWKVVITSDWNGWAEDANKEIATLFNKPSQDLLDTLVGSTELEVLAEFPETVENSLCVVLNKLFSSPDLFTKADDDLRYGDTNSPLGSLAAELADEFLIADGGQCDWKNIGKLRAAGYRVFAGDQDNFGWLVGCIQYDDMIICYG